MRICVSCRAELEAGTWACARCGFEPGLGQGFVELAPPLEDAHGGFGRDAFAELFALEAGHFWFRARNELIGWAIARHFPGAKRILEVGCGTGFVLAHLERTLPEASFVGGEAFSEALAFAATRLRRTELLRVDVRRLPFAREFDLACAFDVLEHVPEDETALASMFDATKPGGGLLVTVPQHRWLWSPADESAHHVRRYTRGELVGKMTRAGFHLLGATSFVSVLLPVMMASRFVSRIGSRGAVSSTGAAELAPPTIVSAAFERLLAAERTAIRAGVSFPAGGSLLVAARRPA